MMKRVLVLLIIGMFFLGNMEIVMGANVSINEKTKLNDGTVNYTINAGGKTIKANLSQYLSGLLDLAIESLRIENDNNTCKENSDWALVGDCKNKRVNDDCGRWLIAGGKCVSSGKNDGKCSCEKVTEGCVCGGDSCQKIIVNGVSYDLGFNYTKSGCKDSYITIKNGGCSIIGEGLYSIKKGEFATEVMKNNCVIRDSSLNDKCNSDLGCYMKRDNICKCTMEGNTNQSKCEKMDNFSYGDTTTEGVEDILKKKYFCVSVDINQIGIRYGKCKNGWKLSRDEGCGCKLYCDSWIEDLNNPRCEEIMNQKISVTDILNESFLLDKGCKGVVNNSNVYGKCSGAWWYRKSTDCNCDLMCDGTVTNVDAKPSQVPIDSLEECNSYSQGSCINTNLAKKISDADSCKYQNQPQSCCSNGQRMICNLDWTDCKCGGGCVATSREYGTESYVRSFCVNELQFEPNYSGCYSVARDENCKCSGLIKSQSWYSCNGMGQAGQLPVEEEGAPIE